MSNVLSSVITKLIVASIKSAHPKYTPTGPFTQVLTSLICSQTIYDGMQMFGKIGCNPTLNEELVAKHFPDFAIVWKAFYSNTVASPASIKEADEIISKWCPIGRGWSDFNPMLSNGQEVAQHLLTKKALKNNKFLIAMVAFIIYYHEEVSGASEDFLAETPLLIGGIVAIQKTTRKLPRQRNSTRMMRGQFTHPMDNSTLRVLITALNLKTSGSSVWEILRHS